MRPASISCSMDPPSAAVTVDLEPDAVVVAAVDAPAARELVDEQQAEAARLLLGRRGPQIELGATARALAPQPLARRGHVDEHALAGVVRASVDHRVVDELGDD